METAGNTVSEIVPIPRTLEVFVESVVVVEFSGRMLVLMSGYSQAFQEGEQVIGRPVSAGVW